MISTVEATSLTFKISQSQFPNIHGRLNKANAFRHALWNVLIAKKCSRFSKSLTSILSWTKRITDWHEEFSPNEELPREMDLHNNRFGRDFYTKNKHLGFDEMIKELLLELEKAVLVKDVKELTNHTIMVYIEP